MRNSDIDDVDIQPWHAVVYQRVASHVCYYSIATVYVGFHALVVIFVFMLEETIRSRRGLQSHQRWGEETEKARISRHIHHFRQANGAE